MSFSKTCLNTVRLGRFLNHFCERYRNADDVEKRLNLTVLRLASDARKPSRSRNQLASWRGKVGKSNIHKPLRGLDNFFSESVKMLKAIYHS